MNTSIRFRSEDWSALLEALWLRGDVESAAVVVAEVQSSDGAATLAVKTLALVPEQAYRVRHADRIEIDPIWMNALCRQARQERRAVVTVHTHLTDGAAQFSWADDVGDSRLMPALSVQIPDTPHGSINITRTDATARVLVGGELRPVRIVVAGDELKVLPRVEEARRSERHSRQELALGRAGQGRLRRICVGVVGLGGTGSVTVELLARLGVESLVLIDGDIIEESNVSRVIGSTLADVGARLSKVAIAARQIRAAAASTTVISHETNIATEGDLAGLVGCDLIFSCVDRLVPRALLNRFAYAAHVPVIDMGSAFRVDGAGKITSQGGKVTIAGPGRPCLWCWGDLDAERVRVETLSNEQRASEEAEGYIVGAAAPQPSVITFNSMLASSATTLFLQLVSGYAEAAAPDRLNFNFITGTVTRAVARRRDGCAFCGTGEQKH